MPVQNTPIRIDSRGTSYEPYPYGLKSGQPTVRLKLSKGESNETSIKSLDNKFRRYGWNQKLQSGFARLRVYGVDPLDASHWKAIEDMNEVISPRFIDLELRDDQLVEEPMRLIWNLVDSFAIVVGEDRSYSTDVFSSFAERSKSYGETEFIFEVDKWSDDEWIEDVTRNHKIYDDDVWLYPKGEKVNTVADNLEKCYQMGKQHTWNVSPRLDILRDYQQDEEGE